MAYKGYCVHDVAEQNELDEPYWSQIIYVDFDTEDEAYKFGVLAEQYEFNQLINELGEKACKLGTMMIPQKEFAAKVDDVISDAAYSMLLDLMMGFEKQGFVEINPMVEWSTPDLEEMLFMEAENLKFSIYDACVRLGLNVESDGREF
jgi:hypothetical protein